MKITRDVIYDLLPGYFAGEVSADTRVLIDEFLATDPEFARMTSRFQRLFDERAADTSPVEGLPDVAGCLVTETWRGTSKVVKTLGFFATRADADACLRRRAEALGRQRFEPGSPAA